MGKGNKRIKRLEERLDTIKKSVVRIVEGLSKMIVNEISDIKDELAGTAERMDRLEKNMAELQHKLEEVAFWRDYHKEEIKEWLERIEGNPNECSKHKKGKLLPRDEYTRSLANIIGFYRERDKGIVERLGKAAILLPEHQSIPNLLGLMADIRNQLKKDLDG